MFHYNLACSYAELDDLDSALGDLKFAFAYRQNGTSWGRRCKRSFLSSDFLLTRGLRARRIKFVRKVRKRASGLFVPSPYVRYYAAECLSLGSSRQTTLFLATGLKTVAHPRFSNDVIGSAVGFYLPA